MPQTTGKFCTKLFSGVDSWKKHKCLIKCVNGAQIILHYLVGYILINNLVLNGTLGKFTKCI